MAQFLCKNSIVFASDLGHGQGEEVDFLFHFFDKQDYWSMLFSFSSIQQ